MVNFVQRSRFCIQRVDKSLNKSGGTVACGKLLYNVDLEILNAKDDLPGSFTPGTSFSTLNRNLINSPFYRIHSMFASLSLTGSSSLLRFCFCLAFAVALFPVC